MALPSFPEGGASNSEGWRNGGRCPSPLPPCHRTGDSAMTSTTTRQVDDAAIPRFNLSAWRTARLGAMKKRPEYQGLPTACRDLVDYMVRRHDNPEHGMCPSQGGLQKGKTPPLSTHFGVSRKTVNERLQKIVDAKVFTKKPRYGERGRMSNRYDLNEALTSPPAATLVTPAGVIASPHPTTD